MNLLEYLRLAAEGLWMNELSSFLTIMGIIIGIAAVITVVAVGQGGRAVLMAEMEKFGTNLFAIYSTVLVAFIFSAAVGIFFGLYPANRAARMNPVEALRQE